MSEQSSSPVRSAASSMRASCWAGVTRTVSSPARAPGGLDESGRSAPKLVDHLVEHLQRRAPLDARSGPAHGVDAEQALAVCVCEDFAQLVLRHLLREVHQRASDARASDAVDYRHVFRMKGW